MKTMQQMQGEMLTKARFDGGYPRPVVLPLGILVLAKDEQEFNRLMRHSYVTHLVLAVGIFLALFVPLCMILYSLLVGN